MKYQAIRTIIKSLSDEQRVLKPQRKTTHFKGIRTVSDPAYRIYQNRFQLRHLFMAYAMIKGKPVPVIKNEQKVINTRLIEQMVKDYTPIEPTEVIEQSA